MHYQINAPPTADATKQADELGRLLKYAQQLIVTHVTVAGGYKPKRARLTVLTVPDKLADQTTRVMQILCDCENATKASAAVRVRPEWTQTAVLVPSATDAPPLDGRLLDGWDSACLAVTYRTGRASALLRCCTEDGARLTALQVPGWTITMKPNPITALASTAGKPYSGPISLTPVPGGMSSTMRAATEAASSTPLPLAPLAEDVAAALTTDEDGVILGVALDGAAVRLSRRSMVLAMIAPSEQRASALLALIRRGMQAGMGVIVAADRGLLPPEALAVWEARARLLDVQDVASSCAIPWRQIAPDLLAHAIAGPTATLDALPSRFAAALDALGAESLKVPAVLGLATMPADNLRGVLAAGGLVIVPQDGDAASLLIARLLMAYLATPPTIGRGVLLLSNPALVPPPDLRDQMIQVVLGERADALLRLQPDSAGWNVNGPDGRHVATMQPDLLTQPATGTGALIASILNEIGNPSDEEDKKDEGGWWAASKRTDDLEIDDTEQLEEAEVVVEDLAGITLPALLMNDVNSEPLTVQTADDIALDLDEALSQLLDALTVEVDSDATMQRVQTAVADEDFTTAEAVATLWSVSHANDVRPWAWRTVLTGDDTERANIAAYALTLDATSPYAPLLVAVLNTMLDTSEPMWEAEADADEQTTSFSFDDESVTDRREHSVDVLDDSPTQPADDLADWLALTQDTETLLPPSRGERVAPLRDDYAALDAFSNDGLLLSESAIVVRDTADEVFMNEAIVTESTPPIMPPAAAMLGPLMSIPATIIEAEVFDDAAIRIHWQAGASVSSLTTRLIASGVDAATARLRVRQAVSGRQSGTPPAPMSLIPSAVTSFVPPVAELAAPAHSSSKDEGLSDDDIWQRWQTGEKADDLILAISGRRGGPAADAARDRIYAVVIPRTVTALDAHDLVDALASGQTITHDPRYPALLQRLARTATPPSGMLERSLRKRLIAARQEV